jgi:hypothetical protein
MSLTPAQTNLPSVYESQKFSYNVGYTAGLGLLTADPRVVSVESSLDDPGITVSFNTSTVTIAGEYTRAFPNKRFTYIPVDNTKLSITTSYGEIPESIYTLTGYQPVGRESITVTYTVASNLGSATINQEVLNSWDQGKAQMLNALAKGVL